MRSMIVAFVLLAAGCTPPLRDGVYACTVASECPLGFDCIAERCRSGTGDECQRDIDCEYRSECTVDTCESGYCVFRTSTDEDGVACDDGIVCNGFDVCSSGACMPAGDPPCPGMCVEGVGCPSCGSLGIACCDAMTGNAADDFCLDGSVCLDGTCSQCGLAGGTCCGTPPFCEPGFGCDTVDERLICDPCGELDAPCCVLEAVPAGDDGGVVSDFDVFCNGPLACGDDGRCQPCGGSGAPVCADGCGPGLYATESGVCRPPSDACGGCSVSETCVDYDTSGFSQCELAGTEDHVCVPGLTDCAEGSCGGTCLGTTQCIYGRCYETFSKPS